MASKGAWRAKVFGEAIENEKLMRQAITRTPEAVVLEYAPLFYDAPPDLYSGPLQDAPDGTYQIIGPAINGGFIAYSFQVVKAGDKILI